ncbi:MAG TPA: hypothetical protein VML96_07625 [Egibacteraceae bacterium]|nr:hypothetical protein [Egibacteraceae bacterium]
MDRRSFLRIVAVLGAGSALGACARSSDRQPRTAATTSATGTLLDAVGAVAPHADEVLSVISASFEQLVGTRPFAFGIVGPDSEPVTGADVDVWVVPADGGEAGGPFAATFHEVPGQSLGVYLAEVAIAAPGPTFFVAVTADGRAGSDAVQVATPDDSQLPAPGQPAIESATPTFDEPTGFERVCTADPPCGMHDISLEQALAEGRPVMLMFATPAYCQTAVCGPSVEILDEVRVSRDWGDTAFIHAEIYSDAGQTLAQSVTDWGLPSEPWLFAIDADGAIADRADGPLLTLPDQVAIMAAKVA